MSELATLFGDSLRRLLAEAAPVEAVQRWEAEGGAPPAWAALEELGLALLLVPEAQGGAGGSLADAAPLVAVLGWHFAPWPAVESLLARRLLAEADLVQPEGSITLALDGGVALWGGAVDHVLHVSGEGLALLPGAACRTEAASLAGEPAGRLDGTGVAERRPLPCDPDELLAEAALLKAAQIAGAAARVVAMTQEYVGVRAQFGRPLAKFQAVQHGLTAAAGQAAAAEMAVAAGAAAAAAGQGQFEMAVAKARASEAAGRVAALAHQLHGAIGFTRQLPLNLGTRRLLAWREDYGNEACWQAWIGHEVARRGGDGLWPLLTRHC